VAAEGSRSLLATDLAAVPPAVSERLLSARRVLTTGHESPDADAVGSALGLALALESRGARVETVFADPVPAMYDFLPAVERAGRAPSPELEPDLIVVCDGDAERTGAVLRENAELFGRVPIVNIDHHVSNSGADETAWVDPAAAATCEQVTLLLPHLGVDFDAVDGAIAQLLMAGIVFDTGNFAHSNVTPRTLRAASELVAAGADLALAARRIYRTKPPGQLKLFGLVLSRLKTADDGRLCWSVVREGDYDDAGAGREMSEGLIDLLSQAAGAEVVLLFKDFGDEVRISVRTRDDGVDATRLAAAYGGGGHARAAGATYTGSVDEAEAAVLAVARRLLDELPAR
jgi:phosphoesterase RecJ-like protein